MNLNDPNTQTGYMEALARSKARDLKRSASMPFDEKLRAVALVSSLLEDSLTEALPKALRKLLGLFDEAIQDRVLDRYALVGGLAVIYYGAPIHTADADLLVTFQASAAGRLDPRPIFDYFESKGARRVDDCLALNGLKFKVLSANDGLTVEAVGTALRTTEGFSVVDLEHLIAMKLLANRSKDRVHIEHLLLSGAQPTEARLQEILQRYGLAERQPFSGCYHRRNTPEHADTHDGTKRWRIFPEKPR
jgi:hypothetical protein